MPTLVVRPAQLEEVEVVLDILSEAARWVRGRGIDQWPERFPEELVAKRIERGEVYLAVDAGRTVGTLTLQWDDPRFWEESDDAGYVHRLALVLSHRGRGLGHELLDWAGSQVVAADRRYLRLDCLSENGSLRAYYEAAGFEHRGDGSGECCHREGAGRHHWKVSLHERAVRTPDSSPPRSQGRRR